MNISFSGSLTERQLRQAIEKQLIGLRFIGGIFVLVALLAAVTSLISSSSKADSSSQIYTYMLGLIGAVFLLLPWFSSRRQYKTSKVLSSQIEGSASEQRLSIKSHLGYAEIPWDSFYRSIVSKNLVMLYQSAYIFHIFPKEFFQAETDWTEFQHCVRQNVKRRKNKLLLFSIIWIALVLLVVLILRFVPNA